MKTNCPHCNRKYDLGKTPLGGKVKCFGCNNSFMLPHSMSILKETSLTAEASKPDAASTVKPKLQTAAENAANHKSFSKIFSEYFVIASLSIAFLLASAAVVCTFYNKVSFQVGIILALAACAIILIPILINLREINRKLKK